MDAAISQNHHLLAFTMSQIYYNEIPTITRLTHPIRMGAQAILDFMESVPLLRL